MHIIGENVAPRSAAQREQERQEIAATLQALKLHYRAEIDEVYSGADEYLSSHISELFTRMDAADAARRLWVTEEKSALWLAIGRHDDALAAFRERTFWQRLRWLVTGR
jgi:hypothetical protein